MVWVLGIFVSQKGYPVSLSSFSSHHSRKWGGTSSVSTLPSRPVGVLFSLSFCTIQKQHGMVSWQRTDLT